MPQSYAPLQAPHASSSVPDPAWSRLACIRRCRSPWWAISIRSSSRPWKKSASLLGYAYSTANTFNIAISGTGTSGMEAAVANFVEPGDKFALLTNGFFGDRIGDLARRHGGEVVRLAKDWGAPFDYDEVREFIRRERPRVVGFVQAETSTGMFNQAKPICDAAHEVDALVIADCVTSLGGMPVLVDENGIDIAYSCSQKGLGCPPGLAPVTVSPRALDRLKQRKTPVDCFYLDLQLLDTFYTGKKYHHTASATHVLRAARGPGDRGGRGSGGALGAASEESRGLRRGHRSDGSEHARPRRPPAVDAEYAAAAAGADDGKSAPSCWKNTTWRSPAASVRWPARFCESARWATARPRRMSQLILQALKDALHR